MKNTEQLRAEAAAVASAIRSTPGAAAEQLGTAIDRNQLTARRIPDSVRDRFLALRAELYARGIYDPVLGSFDSATVNQTDSDAIAQQLDLIAERLQIG